MKPQDIYVAKLAEGLKRLKECDSMLESHERTGDTHVLESAILQVRKGLECIAFASIAPNEKAYSEFRAKAEKQPDFTKDYNASRIIKMLDKVNPDFFPAPISAPISNGFKKWHFERREDQSLTRKQFEAFYDRLGKFLHADNPWGQDKGMKNLVKDIPTVIESIRLLLSWHFTTIRKPDFYGVWVIQTTTDGVPKVITGQSEGDFLVKN